MSEQKTMIQLDAPDIGAAEKERVCAAIDSGFVSTFGPLVGEFERQFAAVVGVDRAVALQTGTAALHMALHVLGVGEGDEVVVPATTFAATMHAVMYVGATPVIADVDPKTWCLSPEAFQAAVTSRTKAVIPVHLYGNLCDMDALLKIAKRNAIFVVEDATEALGAYLSGRHAGMFGDIGCFSFNGNKMVTTGGGGMMVARSSDILSRVVYLINQANPREGMEGYKEVGFNYRMPNLNAALGIAQLGRLKEFLSAKKSFHEIYARRLAATGLCALQETYDGVAPSWWFTAGVFKNAEIASRVQKALSAEDIPSRKIFIPLNTFTYMEAFRKDPCKNAVAIYDRGLCLPSSTLNSEESVERVCRVITDTLGQEERC